MSHLAKTIGEQIRHYRTMRGFTQEQLAEILDSQGTYIGRVERGEQNIQLQTLEKIAEALHTKVSVSFEQLQSEPHDTNTPDEWIPKIIQLLKEQDVDDQERVFRVLREMLADKKRS